MDSDNLAERYELAQKEGQKFIANTWETLNKTVKEYLVTEGVWEVYGKRREDNEEVSFSKVADLEYAIGILHQAAMVDIPSRSKLDAEISYHAYVSQIFDASEEILSKKELHDPVFLRLALVAVRVHEMANLLVRLPGEKEPSIIGIVFDMIWIAIVGITYPFLITAFLIMVSEHDKQVAYVLSYLVFLSGASLWGAHKKSLKHKSKFLSSDEITYNAWLQLSPILRTGPWLAVGVGARVYFEQVIRNGGNIPLIVFDLLTVLENSVKSSGEQ